MKVKWKQCRCFYRVLRSNIDSRWRFVRMTQLVLIHPNRSYTTRHASVIINNFMISTLWVSSKWSRLWVSLKSIITNTCAHVKLHSKFLTCKGCEGNCSEIALYARVLMAVHDLMNCREDVTWFLFTMNSLFVD